MKIDKELIETVVNELVGPDAVEAVNYLVGKKNVSEFIIAEELDVEIHEMRNILYRSYEHNLLTFNRKKDKKKGWYICYWNFNKDQIPHLVNKIRKQKVKKLKGRLEREESTQFYMCNNACVRMDFDKAVEYSFHCPECGEVMQMQDNARTVEFLTQRISELDAGEAL